jgi:hypothetical protein
MKASIKELRKAMLDIDFNLIVNKKKLNNPEGRRFLYHIANQELKVDFYIAIGGTFVIKTKL